MHIENNSYFQSKESHIKVKLYNYLCPLIPKILFSLSLLFLSYSISQVIIFPNKTFIVSIVTAIIVVLCFVLPLKMLLLFTIFVLPFPVLRSVGEANTYWIIIFFISILFRNVINRKGFSFSNPINIPLILLVMTYIISTLFMPSSQMFEGVRATVVLLSCIALFYIIINIISEEQLLWKVITIVGIIYLIQESVGLFQLINPGYRLPMSEISADSVGLQFLGFESRGTFRPAGSFHDHELFAEFIAMGIPLQIFMAQQKRNSFRLLWIICLILSPILLIAVSSRGAVISLAIGLAYWAIINFKKGYFKYQFLWWVIPIILFFILQGYLVKYLEIISPVERFKETTFFGIIPETRVIPWERAIDQIKNAPFFGYGPRLAVDFYRLFGWPHSAYLFYLITVGPIGLGCFIFILFRLFKKSANYIWSSSNYNEHIGLAIALQTSLLIFIIDQIKIGYLRWANYQRFVWLIFGLLVVTLNILKKKDFQHLRD